MNYSALFSNAAISAQFDAIIVRDAAAGRVNQQFRNLLQIAYGVQLPASPVAFADAVNAYRAAKSMPDFEKGPGRIKGARAVHEALAALYTAIVDGGRVNNMPELSPMPAWLAPKAPKTKALKAEAPSAEAPSDEATIIGTNDTPTAGAQLLAEANDALTKVLALLKAGAYDSEQRAALYTALEQSNAAPVAADAEAASPKAKRKARKAKAETEALTEALTPAA